MPGAYGRLSDSVRSPRHIGRDALPAHRGLAPRPPLPRRVAARRPGGRDRPRRRGGPRPTRSTRSSSSGDLYDRALPPVEAVRLADDALARLSELCARRRHLRQPRLGDAAGVRLGAPRARGRARAHRPDADRRARSLLGGALRVRDPVPGARRRARRARRARSAGTGRCWAPRWRAVRADLAHAPGGHAVDRDGARVRRGRAAARERARPRGRRRGERPGSTFAGVDYVALGHLHGPQRVGRQRPLRGLAASPFSFSEAAPAQVRRGRRARRRGAGGRAAPVPGRAAARDAARHARRAARRSRARRARARLGAGDADRPRPPARRDGARCAAASPTRSCSRSTRRAPVRAPGDYYRSACAGSTTTSWCSASSPTSRGSDAEDDELAAAARRAARAGRGRRALPSVDAPAPPALSAFLAFPGREVVDFDASARPGCSCCTATPARARPRCWTPSASRSTATCPGARPGGARLRSDHAGAGRAHRGRPGGHAARAAACGSTRRARAGAAEAAAATA